MTSKNGHKTYITFVLDETGSMQEVRDQTISGFNEFMDSQQDKSLGECRVTLVKFNSKKVETVYADMLVEDVPALTHDTYEPTELTPLYDAIAHAIKDTEDKVSVSQKVLSRLAGHPVTVGPLVILVIMTDGEENASKQYTRADIFNMIKEKEDLGWTIVYLGANQDSWGIAQPLGVAVGSTVNYDPHHTVRAFAGISQAMTDYRSSYQGLAATYANQAAGESDDIKLKEFSAQYAADLKNLQQNYWQGKKKL